MLNKKNLLSVIIPALLLTGCGGSGSDNESAAFSLGISDAPVDELSAVYLCFNAVELKGNGESTMITIGEHPEAMSENNVCGEAKNTAGINLFEFTGAEAIPFVENIEIAAGEYSQMRLIMTDGSYGVYKDSTETVAIEVPSNELKFDGFTVAQGGSVEFTLEFDLRKSMTNPVGKEEYFLKPRGVRLVDNNKVGTLSGTVSDAFILNECEISSPGPDMQLAAVYLYPGQLAIESLEDNSLNDSEFSPLASATVTDDGTGVYSYEIGFIPVGDYTVAITCDTSDQPEILQTDDSLTLPEGVEPIAFIETQPATIQVDTSADASFGS
ncbi:DUF4382 domain-containing protein [Thalassotalea nanhaiensis]|uniref:DUF4382 domain-containing protein n=1 Tax=Thalassotalea nanhaiensis TaxID=3065648 RepID=A0ABY9TPT9_9GAMM|nr:DUF4382 domain-containing protein [Colwelliaceae bacterium SQ345]